MLFFRSHFCSIAKAFQNPTSKSISVLMAYHVKFVAQSAQNRHVYRDIIPKKGKSLIFGILNATWHSMHRISSMRHSWLRRCVTVVHATFSTHWIHSYFRPKRLAHWMILEISNEMLQVFLFFEVDDWCIIFVARVLPFLSCSIFYLFLYI